MGRGTPPVMLPVTRTAVGSLSTRDVVVDLKVFVPTFPSQTMLPLDLTMSVTFGLQLSSPLPVAVTVPPVMLSEFFAHALIAPSNVTVVS